MCDAARAESAPGAIGAQQALGRPAALQPRREVDPDRQRRTRKKDVSHWLAPEFTPRLFTRVLCSERDKGMPASFIRVDATCREATPSPAEKVAASTYDG
jgi:hypothetical protein